MARPKHSEGAVERLDRPSPLHWLGYVDMHGCPENDQTETVRSKMGMLIRPMGYCSLCGCYIRWDEKTRRLHRSKCR